MLPAKPTVYSLPVFRILTTWSFLNTTFTRRREPFGRSRYGIFKYLTTQNHFWRSIDWLPFSKTFGAKIWFWKVDKQIIRQTWRPECKMWKKKRGKIFRRKAIILHWILRFYSHRSPPTMSYIGWGLHLRFCNKKSLHFWPTFSGQKFMHQCLHWLFEYRLYKCNHFYFEIVLQFSQTRSFFQFVSSDFTFWRAKSSVTGITEMSIVEISSVSILVLRVVFCIFSLAALLYAYDSLQLVEDELNTDKISATPPDSLLQKQLPEPDPKDEEQIQRKKTNFQIWCNRVLLSHAQSWWH